MPVVAASIMSSTIRTKSGVPRVVEDVGVVVVKHGRFMAVVVVVSIGPPNDRIESTYCINSSLSSSSKDIVRGRCNVEVSAGGLVVLISGSSCVASVSDAALPSSGGSARGVVDTLESLVMASTLAD